MDIEYKYLAANIFGLVPLFAALAYSKNLRLTAVISGGILAAYSIPAAWMYHEVYWSPINVIDAFWSIEDGMFCFIAGALCWIFAAFPWSERLQMELSTRVVITRLIILSAYAAIVFLSSSVMGFNVLFSFLIMQTISTFTILIIFPRYLLLSISSGALFFGCYFAFLFLCTYLIDDFRGMWNGTELSDFEILGFPIDEYFWVISFSTSYSVTMAFLLKVRLR